MRKIIIIVFILSLSVVLFFSVKYLNQTNDIDYLESIAIKAQLKTSANKKLYYFSNSNERELLFKTQFAFVPNQILIKDIDDISESEIVLLVIDKKIEPAALLINEGFAKSDTFFSDENDYYKLILLKK